MLKRDTERIQDVSLFVGDTLQLVLAERLGETLARFLQRDHDVSLLQGELRLQLLAGSFQLRHMRLSLGERTFHAPKDEGTD
jgi:hypothetical protein